jgi:hypothetical protein
MGEDAEEVEQRRIPRFRVTFRERERELDLLVGVGSQFE